ncbi:hypothetical protein F4823DRAFT_633060 [Ustulina deusta]|nr:hypothetical protein F4823DRAFT_633060 [Ustulina deusta]
MKSLNHLRFIATAVFFAGATAIQKPSLTHLCTINITTSAGISIGTIPAGTLVTIPITGGSFAGPKLNGKVVSGGADQSITDANGIFSPDGRFILQTKDGANISFRDWGYAPFVYASFETGFTAYEWLNSVVAVGQIAQTSTGASIAIYELGSTPLKSSRLAPQLI